MLYLLFKFKLFYKNIVMNIQKKLSRGLTPRQKNYNHNLPNKIQNLDTEQAKITTLITNSVNTDNIKSQNADIGSIKLGYDRENESGYIKIPARFSISSENGDDIIVIDENGEIIMQKINIIDSINCRDGKFIGNLEAANVSLLGDITSTNNHVTNQLNVDGNIISTNIRTTNISTTNINATMGNFNNGLKTNGILVNGITETPQISSKQDLILSVAPDHAVSIPNIRYNINTANIHVIGPAEIKLSKIFIASGDVRLMADDTCNGIEIAVFNNNVATIKITGPQYITSITQKSIKKFTYLSLLQRWIES